MLTTYLTDKTGELTAARRILEVVEEKSDYSEQEQAEITKYMKLFKHGEGFFYGNTGKRMVAHGKTG